MSCQVELQSGRRGSEERTVGECKLRQEGGGLEKEVSAGDTMKSSMSGR